MDDYREMAKIYRDLADLAEEMAVLEDREKAGEDVEDEMAALLGRLMFKSMALNK